MMLDHVDECERATRVRHALEETVREGKRTTRDLGGNASTLEFADAISSRLN